MFNFSLRAVAALLFFLVVSSVYAQTKVVVIPLFGDDAPAPIEYAIGDTGPGGGIVFHVTNGGLHGLEAASVDQAEVEWGCLTVDIDVVVNLDDNSSTDPLSGACITPLVAIDCEGAAAAAADYVWPNGQMDGFLPNREELDLLYDQRNIEGLVGGFVSEGYWSSSEGILRDGNTGLAWVQSFSGEVSGAQVAINKNFPFGVRAVRAF